MEKENLIADPSTRWGNDTTWRVYRLLADNTATLARCREIAQMHREKASLLPSAVQSREEVALDIHLYVANIIARREEAPWWLRESLWGTDLQQVVWEQVARAFLWW